MTLTATVSRPMEAYSSSSTSPLAVSFLASPWFSSTAAHLQIFRGLRVILPSCFYSNCGSPGISALLLSTTSVCFRHHDTAGTSLRHVSHRHIHKALLTTALVTRNLILSNLRGHSSIFRLALTSSLRHQFTSPSIMPSLPCSACPSISSPSFCVMRKGGGSVTHNCHGRGIHL